MSVSLPKMVWDGPRGLGSATVKAPSTLAGKSIWEVKDKRLLRTRGCSGLDGEALALSTDMSALCTFHLEMYSGSPEDVV